MSASVLPELEKDARTRRWGRVAAGMFLLLVLIVGAVRSMPEMSPLDYPVSLISALRVLHGERPNADFNALYGPLGHYVGAGWLYVFRFLAPATAINVLYSCCTLVWLGLLWWSARPLMKAGVSLLSVVLVAYLFLTVPLVAHFSYYSMLPTVGLVWGVLVARRMF